MATARVARTQVPTNSAIPQRIEQSFVEICIACGNRLEPPQLFTRKSSVTTGRIGSKRTHWRALTKQPCSCTNRPLLFTSYRIHPGSNLLQRNSLRFNHHRLDPDQL